MKTLKNELVYDNCKSKCEHVGKDREFICINGISCKITMPQSDMAQAASDFIAAIKEIATKPKNLDNLESYLSLHFVKWLEKYANTPEDIATEMKNFAKMDI